MQLSIDVLVNISIDFSSTFYYSTDIDSGNTFLKSLLESILTINIGALLTVLHLHSTNQLRKDLNRFMQY